MPLVPSVISNDVRRLPKGGVVVRKGKPLMSYQFFQQSRCCHQAKPRDDQGRWEYGYQWQYHEILMYNTTKVCACCHHEQPSRAFQRPTKDTSFFALAKVKGIGVHGYVEEALQCIL